MLRSPFLRILCLLLVLSGRFTVLAQVNTASLSGLATDSTGAALPHVTVTAQDDANGYTRTVQTDLSGAYSFQDLPIGQYKVKVSAPGFDSLVEDITLSVGQR